MYICNKNNEIEMWHWKRDSQRSKHTRITVEKIYRSITLMWIVARHKALTTHYSDLALVILEV